MYIFTKIISSARRLLHWETRIFFFIGILVLAAGPFSAALRADTLVLKNGQIYKNVKTQIKGLRIYVYRPQGRRLSFPAAQIQSLTPSTVDWPQKTPNKNTTKATDKRRPPPKKKVPDATQKKPADSPLSGREKEKNKKLPKKMQSSKETCKTCSNSNFWQNPWSLALQGAIPIWSGLYQNKDTRLYGYFLSALELLAFLNVGAYSETPVPLQERLFPQILLLSAAIPSPTQLPISGQPPSFNAQIFVSSYLLLSLQDQVIGPGGEILARKDFETKKARTGIVLLALLATDAVSSVLYGGPSKKAPSQARHKGFHWNFGFSDMAQSQASLQEKRPTFLRPTVEFRWYF